MALGNGVWGLGFWDIGSRLAKVGGLRLERLTKVSGFGAWGLEFFAFLEVQDFGFWGFC